MQSEIRRIRVITGPTASGKTDRALRLAEEDRSLEIVNADASLLSRGFNIGTAKPDASTLARIPHHLIDIVDPAERFSASEYSARARQAIEDILSRDRQPLVVGGTGFYIDALFGKLASFEVDPTVADLAKKRIKSEVAEFGFDTMHERLRSIDPVLYEQILRERNPLRLYRAWEHYYATGEPLGVARQRFAASSSGITFEPEFDVIMRPRLELLGRIETRTNDMLAKGWLEEARGLKEQGVTREMPAMRAIGYRELFDVLDGVMTIEEAREQIIVRTRQYAKRQVTWMKKYLRENQRENDSRADQE